MMQERNSYLTPPVAARKTLSFTAARPRVLAQWVAQLPKVNHAETSRQLYLAVREINELKIGPADRMELLDLLAQSIEEASDALFRQYLHPLTLSERERKVVSLAQGLAIELATGYKAAATAASASLWGRSRKETEVRALHHGIWAILPSLRRRYSLYLPSPKGLWIELHTLYRRGEQLGAGEEKLPWGAQTCSINQAYKAALLFSIAQPYQLQRYELELAYSACLAWADLATLTPPAEQTTYLVDLNQDQAPTYRNENAAVTPDCLGLNTSKLLTLLTSNTVLPNVRGMMPRLQDHLAMAWDRAQPRRFRRQPDTQAIELTIGLSAVHSQLCDNQSFRSFLQPYDVSELKEDAQKERFQARDTRDIEQSKDIWEHSFDAGGSHFPPIPSPEEEAENSPAVEDRVTAPVYCMNSTDMSPRGFRLHWTDQIPDALVMGEVINIKPAQSKHWTIGLLRWLRQAGGTDLYLGVELLSPKAEACAVRILNKTGLHSGYLRAFVLPEISALAQPESVLLPHLKAQVGQKILLCRRGEQQVYRLMQKITETSAVGQFSIRDTTQIGIEGAPLTDAETDHSDEVLWDLKK